jgi:hypothetical protein
VSDPSYTLAHTAHAQLITLSLAPDLSKPSNPSHPILEATSSSTR